MKTEQPKTATAASSKARRKLEAPAKTRMEKVLGDLQHLMAGIRTGRASVAVFDNIKVDYYEHADAAKSAKLRICTCRNRR